MSKFLHGPPKFSRGPPVGDRCSKELGPVNLVSSQNLLIGLPRITLHCPSVIRTIWGKRGPDYPGIRITEGKLRDVGNIKQDRRYMCNVTLRRVRVTIVVVEKK
jgi:hypothetical protein